MSRVLNYRAFGFAYSSITTLLLFIELAISLFLFNFRDLCLLLLYSVLIHILHRPYRNGPGGNIAPKDRDKRVGERKVFKW